MSPQPKVLVIRLSSLGDVVLSTSVLEPLQRAGLSISFVTKSAFAPLLQGHPAVDEVYGFDPKRNGEAQAREDLLRWAREQGFLFVLDLQDSWRTRLWRWRMGGSTRVFVARKERLREWVIFFLRLGRFVSFGRGGRALKFRRAALEALGSLGLPTDANGPLTWLHVTEQERAKVRPRLPAEPFAALLPASAWRGKEWPYFPELAVRLAVKVPVVALGAAADLGADQAAAAAGARGRSLRGQTSLRESLAVLAEARWVIGNDTGLVHGAEALGKDVAMVEGPTHEYMGFSPYRPGSALLGVPLWCRPCSKSGWICPRFGTYKCLRDLTAASAAALLAQKGYPC